MAKYDPLHNFLLATNSTIQNMQVSFVQIEQIIGDLLPNSAREHRAWWANPSSPYDHPYAQSWLRAGWKVDSVDFHREIVQFQRA